MKQKRPHWRRLDNAAKLFSAASTKHDTRVFRFYCELKEEVCPEVLQQALDITVETFPIFLSVLRKGLFWHYLEPSSQRPEVREEYREPCSRLYIRDKQTLLFEVTYYKKRINFEVFHVLTNGTGATEFLRELVKNYLYLAHQGDGLAQVSLQPEEMTIQDQEDDSFLKYYSKTMKRPIKRKPRAFQMKKHRKDNQQLQVREGVVSVKDVLKRSRELGVSMTVFLTIALIMAIHKEMSKMQEHRPVVLMVPVNLRKFFPSASMLNFFNWIEPGYDFSKGTVPNAKGTVSNAKGTVPSEDTTSVVSSEVPFETVLESVKQYFQENLTKEKMAEHMSELISLEMHPILRLAPLELKNLCIHVGAKFSEKKVTAILSNMSVVQMPPEYVPYIERFGVYTSTPKMELCLCSFQDKLSLGFTSRFDTENIQRNFYRILREQGIESEKIKPDFPEPGVPGELEMKVYKIFTFCCLALAAFLIVTDINYHPRVRWTLFTAGGVASMWLASSIGFFKRYNLLKNAMWQLLIVTGACFVWDWLTGWHGWSVDLVLPIVSIGILISMVIISAVQKYQAKEYMIYLVMAAGYGMILPFILLLTGAVHKRIPSMFGSLFCFLFLIGLILFKGKEFWEEIQKKFHV